MFVGVRAEHDGSEGPHQKTGAKGHEGEHQGRELIATREERRPDRCCVVAEDHEVVHLQKISDGDADDQPQFGCESGVSRHFSTSRPDLSDLCASRLPARRDTPRTHSITSASTTSPSPALVCWVDPADWDEDSVRADAVDITCDTRRRSSWTPLIAFTSSLCSARRAVSSAFSTSDRSAAESFAA